MGTTGLRRIGLAKGYGRQPALPLDSSRVTFVQSQVYRPDIAAGKGLFWLAYQGRDRVAADRASCCFLAQSIDKGGDKSDRSRERRSDENSDSRHGARLRHVPVHGGNDGDVMQRIERA